MSKKRFTDVLIWSKEWFMDLSPKHKCLVRFLFDNCDAAGVWSPNWKLASMQIGELVSMADMQLIPTSQWELIAGQKIFLPDFINFQYGKLSESSPAHKPVFASIQKHNLFNRLSDRVSNTLQEKDKDKDKDKEEDNKEGGAGETEPIVNEAYLSPKMMGVFKKHIPGYPIDLEEDMRALRLIAKFICKQSEKSYQPQETDVGNMVLEAWEIIVQFIANSSFYQDFSLKSIQNNIQTITQKIRSGQTNPKTGKSGTGAGQKAGSTLNQKFDQFYNQGERAANTG